MELMPSHHIVGEKGLKTKVSGDAIEKHKQELVNYIREEESHIVYVEDKLIDPTNSIKQFGHVLTSLDLETKLKTVLPSRLTFIDNPFNTTKRAVVLITKPNEFFTGGFETVCPYEKGILPEHSIMQLVEKEVPDSDYILRRKTMNRKDLPKHEYKTGEGFIFEEGAARPGFKKIKQVGHEIKRGWRTVLIYLMRAGYLTVSDAERLFGVDTSTSWAFHTGRKNYIDVPW